jgi:hypothetical protein
MEFGVGALAPNVEVFDSDRHEHNNIITIGGAGAICTFV